MAGNKNSALNAAKAAKQDEFYTQLADIENEVKHYRKHFKGKTVLCNCDDPRVSNFWRFFSENFEFLGLKKLIATCYKSQQTDLFSQHDCESAIAQVYEGDTNGNMKVDDDEVSVIQLKGDGDFRSDECLGFLYESDIVVTNPPFSLLNEFIRLMINKDKKFLIIGQHNAIHYADIFPLVKNGDVWLGYKYGDMKFMVPADSEPRKTRYWQDDTGQKWRSLGNACWFTNLDIKKRHDDFVTGKHYKRDEYRTLDNYDALFINTINDIPDDYDGEMAVPITFISRHNPDQYEIVGILNHGCDNEFDFAKPILDGKEKFSRILIRRKKGVN